MAFGALGDCLLILNIPGRVMAILDYMAFWAFVLYLAWLLVLWSDPWHNPTINQAAIESNLLATSLLLSHNR